MSVESTANGMRNGSKKISFYMFVKKIKHKVM